MNYCCIFPETENVHLMKDVGAIAYTFYKEYGFDSYIATYDNGPYEYLNNEVQGLKLDFIKKITGNSTLDSLLYVIKNAKRLDCIQTFHPGMRALFQCYLYKLFNSKGKCYLKMDMNFEKMTEKPFIKKGLKGRIKKYIIENKIDLITTESSKGMKYLNEKYGWNIKHIENGFRPRSIEQIDKENIIITVGRIGNKEKNNELLLEAFKEIYMQIPNWKLKMIGPIEEEFKNYIQKYKNDKELEKKVEFTGLIEEKEKLMKEYNIAKIFVLTSRSESFPLVCSEALAGGDYMILSDFDTAQDVIKYSYVGEIFKRGNKQELKNKLLEACKKLEKEYEFNNIQNYANEELTWKEICGKIKKNLNI